MDDLVAEFVAEATGELDRLDPALARLIDSPADGASIDEVFRAVHSIRGACGFLGLDRLGAVTEAAERALVRLKAKQAAASPLDIQRLQASIDRARAILAALAGPAAGGAASSLAELDAVAQSLTAADGRLRASQATGSQPEALLEAASAAMDARAVLRRTEGAPLADVWRSLGLLTDSLDDQLGKQTVLDLQGGDIVVNLDVAAALKPSLVQLVRNACDHGLEAPEARLAAGKPVAGRIAISARRTGDDIVITVADDGRGLATPTDDWSLPEPLSTRIFEPGFTTGGSVGISGRGVGLDIVRDRIGRVGGRVDVSSEPGGGATFTLTLPDAAARPLADHYVVFSAAGAGRAALPGPTVAAIHDVDRAAIAETPDGPRVRIKGISTPLVMLCAASDDDLLSLLLVDVDGRRIAVAVDEVLDIVERDRLDAPVFELDARACWAPAVAHDPASNAGEALRA